VVATGTLPSDNGAVVVVNGNVGGGPCVNTANGSVGATGSTAGFPGSKINPDPSVEPGVPGVGVGVGAAAAGELISAPSPSSKQVISSVDPATRRTPGRRDGGVIAQHPPG
jgi:hypothetical protein